MADTIRSYCYSTFVVFTPVAEQSEEQKLQPNSIKTSRSSKRPYFKKQLLSVLAKFKREMGANISVETEAI